MAYSFEIVFADVRHKFRTAVKPESPVEFGGATRAQDAYVPNSLFLIFAAVARIAVTHRWFSPAAPDT